MQVEAGGDHYFSAGGYTSGNGEGGQMSGVNGEGSQAGGSGEAGCGYYTLCSNFTNQEIRPYFGNGGAWNIMWGRDHAGSGGEAGSGGIIKYVDASLIYAFNGNRITNGDYDSTYYEYDKDGNLLDGSSYIDDSGIERNKDIVFAKYLTKKDGSKILLAKNFAQAGVIRATFYTNQHMTKEECEYYGVDYIDGSSDKNTTFVKITEENLSNPLTGYVNQITKNEQGIGSGFGRLEKTNGVFQSIDK